MDSDELKIEKVTKHMYASVREDGTSRTGSRQITVSLPRVRWLERDGDYISPPEPAPVAAHTSEVVEEFHESYGQPLSDVEQQAFDLRKQGLSYAQIADAMKTTHSKVKNYLSRAMRKTSARPVTGRANYSRHYNRNRKRVVN